MQLSMLRFLAYALIIIPALHFAHHYWQSKQQEEHCYGISPVMLEVEQISKECEKIFQEKYTKREWPRIVVTELLVILGMFLLFFINKKSKGKNNV